MYTQSRESCLPCSAIQPKGQVYVTDRRWAVFLQLLLPMLRKLDQFAFTFTRLPG